MIERPAPSRRLDAAEQPELRVEYDPVTGAATRVYIGALDITHLVVRVQTNTCLGQTSREVVLRSRRGRPSPAVPQ